ncbi:LacI family DNA-binding transcriptional regulator [Nocardiopsis composta]|uniref:DNA-binding LacI/PurR family transcriptional regulator n=3 Tax=Nocardiopsis composta TaxID=157465 RepID=A0A7W8QK82_9ACTN|nr:LacI family DNA-binding transcriptional regulator [Nocardiopsis composta]MBB5431992.1 DNA-binding LacI/PurR family transcriptional regulator [Nocardiopsis composta]
MDGERRPTLEAVARHAGVGRGTVSRVINGSERVSDRTREAVLHAIEELGYVPNRAARTLVTRRTDMVALVVSESEERLFAQPFFAGIVRGVSGVLTERGLQLLLATARTAAEHERLGDYLVGGHVDGVLLVSLHADDPLPGRLTAAGIPFVLGGRPAHPGGEPVHYVDIDNVGGAELAVRRLAGTGRRRIATVAGPADMPAGQDRLDGYRRALEDAGLEPDPALVAWGDFSHEGGARAMRELLEAAPDLDAVFAASDDMALAALRVLRESGRRVPEDVALVGYDDTALAASADPPLTTVHQPTERMGGEMAQVLADRALARTAPEGIVLETRLVVRASG